MPEAPSSTAKYLARLERETRALRPIPAGRVAPWHAIAGALTGAVLTFMLTVPGHGIGHFPWPLTLGLALAGGTLSGLAGRALWNGLLAGSAQILADQVRSNLLDHELLLLCSSSELPAHYAKLRRVAQSYGKTRARNWEEIDRQSMRQRVQWLVENYSVICRTLGLPYSTPALRRLQGITLGLVFVPLGLVLLSMTGLLLTQGHEPWRTVLLGGFGLQLAAVPLLATAMQMGTQLERGELLQVLTAELALGDRDLPAAEGSQVAEQAAGNESLASTTAAVLDGPQVDRRIRE